MEQGHFSRGRSPPRRLEPHPACVMDRLPLQLTTTSGAFNCGWGVGLKQSSTADSPLLKIRSPHARRLLSRNTDVSNIAT